MRNIYVIKNQFELEGIMMLGNIIEESPLQTNEGLGFVAKKEQLTDFGLDKVQELHSVEALENKLFSDIDSQGYSEIMYCPYVEEFIKKNYDCKMIIVEGKIKVTEK